MKRIIAVTGALLLCAVLAACSQSSVAALVTMLGIAALEGNTPLAAMLQADTAAASSAVLNWKSGSPTQNVIQALNLVEADLNLIPGSSKYAPLVVLAIGTVESIMEIIHPGSSSPTGINSRKGVTHRVYLAHPPKTEAQFKKEWNALAVGQLSNAAIK